MLRNTSQIHASAVDTEVKNLSRRGQFMNKEAITGDPRLPLEHPGRLGVYCGTPAPLQIRFMSVQGEGHTSRAGYSYTVLGAVL